MLLLSWVRFSSKVISFATSGKQITTNHNHFTLYFTCIIRLLILKFCISDITCKVKLEDKQLRCKQPWVAFHMCVFYCCINTCCFTLTHKP